ncbi:hypothetical protein [Parabacteroides sp. PF5-6]|uniref:hypothetical protein n=1 Tax=Parabacteroides sp. PF5-6 TaxID=1742403 RepID=UPI0024067107|nr:hypothetical protein [Parabacteroides sp. PF5-6]MDF9830042.1 hypothetical protein [Parabacteroides sp. PF5-6]
MTLKQFLSLAPRVAKYNMKVIFAGKFFWFLLAALAFFCLFMFQFAWEQEEINEGILYELLIFPAVLLIFYPAVFGIQNDEDARILELLFGIPNYKYKVWGVRLLMIYVGIFFILLGFGYLAVILIYPINPFEMTIQLMFPLLFYGNMAFMFSTLTRSGNGTAVVVIVTSILMLFFSNMPFIERTFWNVLLNPFRVPNNFMPAIWEGIVIKSRIFLLIGSMIWMMIGLLKLQQREKFVG